MDFGLENEVFTPNLALKQLQVRSEHFDDEIVVDNNLDEESVLAEDTTAPVQIELDDIQSEIDFWNSTVVCYIVGANPPINVMEGYVRRIWGSLKVDKVVLVKKGVYQDVDMEKEVVQVVPIWIQLKLNFKYWSEKAIFKIVSQLGKPIKRDYATACRDKIQFARVMVEVPMAASLPDHIFFMNEHGEKVQVELRYEWKPTLCAKCNMVGHVETDCRQGKSRKVWVQKQKQGGAQPQQVVHPAIEVDQEGFQRALRPIRVRVDSVEPTHVANPFDILQNESMNESTDNLPGGEDEVRRFIQKFDIGLVGLLEHKVKGANIGKIYQRVFTNWCFTGNVSFHKGRRIVVAWKPGSFTRLALWRDLKTLSTQEPWIMGGDFNCVMTSEERIGAPVRQAEISGINECMHDCSMEDVKCVGNMFTWNNKQQGNARVFSKLDRVLANPAWHDVYTDAEVCFMSEGEFDHSPGLLTLYPRVAGGKKLFRYYTMWKTAPNFNAIIQDVWSEQINGSKMYVLVSKLKKIKLALKELNKIGFTDIQAADIKAHQLLMEAQKAMHSNPTDQTLADLELAAIKEYKRHHQVYMDFLKQKAKMEWIKAGDENTVLFHQSIKTRNVQNQVYSIHDMHGNWQDTTDTVSGAFLEYYMKLLGTNQADSKPVFKEIVLVGPVITDQHRTILTADYTKEEVKSALFSIPGTKAPGSDGFGSFFYKDDWHIVGDEVINDVLDVLNNGKLLKEMNHTVLPDLILENEGGFVHGRYIVHNIMVIQDLVRYYGRKSVKPSCLLKVDLQKAYDTVDWCFLQEMLEILGFLDKFVKLVMTCVTTPMFSLMINRILHKLTELPQFHYHPRCKDLKLTHLCFADDLILCCKGDYPSIYSLLQAFVLFSKSSGLMANKRKYAVYCHGMAESDVTRVVEASGFVRSVLPFKYLGVLICSKKISAGQCDVLVDKMTARIKMWSTRNLSYTARMQLINSVLLSLHMYWAQVYILPRSVLLDIIKICKAFLWSGQTYSTKPSNIAWERVCSPK
ncbi:uncharacterized protein [Spinacia oleracea]|uniref:Reverse transcriptase domain-containing protein n=1 Tax=Spinacia oleracea TaxID=3562 RepID=A0ABM3R844_SPIOL|nr:uncharacterized protein LOC110795424 [Spinacia oleracea]